MRIFIGQLLALGGSLLACGALEIGDRVGPVPLVALDGRSLTIYLLKEGGEYRISQASMAFPELTVPELNRFLDQRSTLKETSLILSFRDWVRERFKTG